MQDVVLHDRFDESQRSNAKEWINFRYARLWAKENWTFKQTTTTVSVALDGSSAPLGGLKRVFAVYDQTVSPLYNEVPGIQPSEFYGDATRTSGIPVGFTVIGDNIIFDSPVSSGRTYLVFGELEFTELSADSDEPLVPAEFHRVITHGAISEGLRQENDPTWQAAEEDYKNGYEDMKGSYLTSVIPYRGAYPSWPAWA